MTIDEVREQLSAYLDGELDEPTRRAVDAALKAHPELRAELDALRRTVALVRSMPRRSAPSGFAERVQAAIAQKAAGAVPLGRSARADWLRHWRAVALAAAACLVVGVTALVASRTSTTRDSARRFETTPAAPEATAPSATEGSEGPADRAEPGRAGKGVKLADGEVGRALETGDEADRDRGRRRFGEVAEGERADRVDAARPREAIPRAGAAPATPARAAARRAPGPAEVVAEVRRPKAAPAKPEPPAAGRLPRTEEEEAQEAGRRARTMAEAEPEGQAPTMVRAKRGRVVGRQAAEAEAFAAVKPAEDSRGAQAPGAAAPPAAAVNGVEREASGAWARVLVRDELVLAIERKGRLPRRQVLAAEDAGAWYHAGPGVMVREVGFVYHDLRGCLAQVRLALEAANVAYALQPVGSGRFVVETQMAKAEVSALLSHLKAAAPALKRKALTRMARRREAPPRRASREPVTAGQQMVRLKLRFDRAGRAAAPAAREK